ncbi:erythronate-4-phosphate dehydrogenase [Legionella norrlandica]|uniref:Erythronate-4-phosphate dehydrogenase n=1 Tax=Legionella norrlandica TaxID=1498499 RepID=A0A0A2SSP4_9GAMM|nr:4-phosphoerythronate dehydrogenase [Legionella norrlandica]KGP64155.1 erythronate-4-phosphate dehydrogenase [Legionella norrlandica]
MNILADALLPGLDAAFPKPFTLTLYHNPDEIPELLANKDIILCRSTVKVNSTLLKKHSIKFIATATSGTDHLDFDFLKSQNIEIIDAKGCNATSVADYVVACIAYLEERQLIKGKMAGIIGLGQVGTKVYERLKTNEFQLSLYDPPKASRNTAFQSCSLEDLYDCDLLCIHAELHNNHPYPSTNLISEEFLKKLKPGCVIINASRGGIVNEEALLHINSSIVYCTDVYNHEPNIDKRVVSKATLCTPHIAGHSLEAKFAAVAIVSDQLHRVLGLPSPQFATPEKPPIQHNHKDWKELVLSIYNPINETLQLKQAENIRSTFLTLRKNHKQRHDFATYFETEFIKKYPLLGYLGQ